jgi:hypothetical protein
MGKKIRIDRCTSCGNRLIQNCKNCNGFKKFKPLHINQPNYLEKTMKEDK